MSGKSTMRRRCGGFGSLTVCYALSACAPAAAPPAAAPQVSSSAAGGDAVSPSPQTVTVVNQPPDFELDTLEGDSVRLSDLVGNRVILLDFWATYCDPCLVAMPHLQKLYDQYREQGFIVLGISIDGPESAASVRSTVAKLRVEFPVLLDDDSRVVAQYNPKTSAPFSVLIGRDGRILAQQEGFTTGNAAALDEAVAEAVAARLP